MLIGLGSCGVPSNLVWEMLFPEFVLKFIILGVWFEVKSCPIYSFDSMLVFSVWFNSYLLALFGIGEKLLKSVFWKALFKLFAVFLKF